MDPNSYQSMKNDYVEEEEEGKKVPSQQLKKNYLHQREDVWNQYCHLDLKWGILQKKIVCLIEIDPNEVNLEEKNDPAAKNHWKLSTKKL